MRNARVSPRRALRPNPAVVVDPVSHREQASGLGLKVEWRQEERPVLVLARKPGTEAPATGQSNVFSSMPRSGQITLEHASMKQVAEYLGGFAGGKLGVDETGLRGEYDLTLKWTPGDKESLSKALAGFGLEIRTAPRKVPILHAAVEARLGDKAAQR